MQREIQEARRAVRENPDDVEAVLDLARRLERAGLRAASFAALDAGLERTDAPELRQAVDGYFEGLELAPPGEPVLLLPPEVLPMGRRVPRALDTQAVALDPAETRLAVGFSDGRVSIYELAACLADPAGARPAMTLQAVTGAAACLRFSCDGEELAVGGGDAAVWNLRTGQRVRCLGKSFLHCWDVNWYRGELLAGTGDFFPAGEERRREVPRFAGYAPRRPMDPDLEELGRGLFGGDPPREPAIGGREAPDLVVVDDHSRFAGVLSGGELRLRRRGREEEERYSGLELPVLIRPEPDRPLNRAYPPLLHPTGRWLLGRLSLKGAGAAVFRRPRKGEFGPALRLFRLGEPVEVLDFLPGTLVPRLLAFSPAGLRLLVLTYRDGLFLIDLVDEPVARLEPPEEPDRLALHQEGALLPARPKPLREVGEPELLGRLGKPYPSRHWAGDRPLEILLSGSQLRVWVKDRGVREASLDDEEPRLRSTRAPAEKRPPIPGEVPTGEIPSDLELRNPAAVVSPESSLVLAWSRPRQNQVWLYDREDPGNRRALEASVGVHLARFSTSGDRIVLALEDETFLFFGVAEGPSG